MERDEAFAVLVERVAACRLCPAMEGRRRVLTRANGDIDAPVLFVAEAPGRGGAGGRASPSLAISPGRRFSGCSVR